MKDLDKKNKEFLKQKIETKAQKNKNYKNVTYERRSLQIEYIINIYIYTLD